MTIRFWILDFELNEFNHLIICSFVHLFISEVKMYQ